MIHVLSTFEKVAEKHQIRFGYRYIDLTSPKTSFGALNEVAIALNSTNRKYRKGIPTEYMQSSIAKALAHYGGYLTLLIFVFRGNPSTDSELMCKLISPIK